MLGTQAPCTEIKPLFLTIYNHGDTVDIRQPASLGMTHRMTDIVAELWRFVT
jgi:hypothetical protein